MPLVAGKCRPPSSPGSWPQKGSPISTPEKKAGIRQVAATIFFGLFAIGKRNTWHKDGATVTLFQVAVGAIVGLVIVIALLVALVLLITR